MDVNADADAEISCTLSNFVLQGRVERIGANLENLVGDFEWTESNSKMTGFSKVSLCI